MSRPPAAAAAAATPADAVHSHGLHGSRRHGDTAIYALALLVGTLAGLAGTAFHLLAQGLVGWQQRWAGGPLATVGVALGGAGCLTLAVFLVRRFAPEAAGSGIPEVEAALAGDRMIRWRRVLPVKFAAGLLAQASGLVAGREGPTIHMAAAIAQWADERWRLDEADRKGLLAAGAAAGLAAAFAAPVAAILFILEETRRQFRYSLRSYMAVILATCASAFVTGELAGVLPDLAIAAAAPALQLMPLFVLLGALVGGMGVLFNAGLLAALGLADRVRAGLGGRGFLLVTFAVGLVLGGLAVTLPAATGPGDALIPRLVALDHGLGFLLLLALMRLAGALVSYPLGAPGGIFAPMLTLATTLGLAFAAAATLVLPGLDSLAPGLAIAAMGALFTASVRAPMVGTVLVLELTGAFALALPVLVACAVANLAANWLGGRPIYEQLLERRLGTALRRCQEAPGSEPAGLAR